MRKKTRNGDAPEPDEWVYDEESPKRPLSRMQSQDFQDGFAQVIHFTVNGDVHLGAQDPSVVERASSPHARRSSWIARFLERCKFWGRREPVRSRARIRSTISAPDPERPPAEFDFEAHARTSARKHDITPELRAEHLYNIWFEGIESCVNAGLDLYLSLEFVL